MVHYKLSYFPGRGAGEVSRQILAFGGQDFEDNRISLEDWPKFKSGTPFHQLTLLEVDGKIIAQSHAIARYLGKQFGINGKDAWEEAQTNAIADQFKDYQNEIRPYFIVVIGFGQGDIEKLKADVFLPALKKHYAYFQRILKANGSGFFVGKSLTWVDLLIAQHTADLLEKDASVLAKFPELVEHQKKIHSNANIKKWIETRPVTPF